MAQASFTGEAEIDGLVTGTAGVTLSANEAVLERLAVTVGSTKAQGRLTVRNFASPEIDFTLSADTIDVVELQRLLAAARNETRPEFSENARPGQATNDGILLRTTGAGRLHAGTIRYNKLVLENAQAEARLDRGVITLQPLTASVFGGRHRGSVLVDARQMPTAVTVDSRFEQVDANRLVSATTNLDEVVTGTLDSSNQVTFVADGKGTVAPSLNGTLSLIIPDGSIEHMDLKHAIAALAGFNTGDDDRQVTKVRDLSAHFTVTDGVAHTDDLAATLDDNSTIAGAGSINLVDQALNLRLTAVLSREFSDRVGGRGVARIVRTVFANPSGDLVVSMRVTGTTRRPRFAPDLERIAEMKLGDRLPNPAGKVKEALGRILGGRRTREPAQGK
jgi:AsmA protein